jgi:hypothetical protein
MRFGIPKSYKFLLEENKRLEEELRDDCQISVAPMMDYEDERDDGGKLKRHAECIYQ